MTRLMPSSSVIGWPVSRFLTTRSIPRATSSMLSERGRGMSDLPVNCKAKGPMSSWSPTCRVAAARRRCPLTYVPLALLRSVTIAFFPFREIDAWRRETCG